MPYGGPTHTTQIIGRVLCISSYSLSLLVSLGDFFAPSATLQAVMPRGWAVAVATILGVLSIVGIIAVITRRWRIEWVASTAIAFLLLERSVPVWGRIISGYPENTSAGSMMLLGAVCLGQRALSLWIFAIKTRQTAETSRDVG